MAAKKKIIEEENPNGAPEWMVTFSDCMTLLLTFFVLLLSFATFHKETLPHLGFSFAQALPTIGMSASQKHESMIRKIEINDPVNRDEGSEVQTSVTQQTSNFMREKRPLDFRNLKVFTTESSSFFFGRGAALSSRGQQTLDAMAVFLAHQTGRVVISENGPDGNPELGLMRAAAVMHYLIEQKGLSPNRFCLSVHSTTREKSTRRQLEITLLERSVYE